MDLLLGGDVCDILSPKYFFPTTSIDNPAFKSKSTFITLTNSPTWVWLCPLFFDHHYAQSFLICSLFLGDRSGYSSIQFPYLFQQWWQCSSPSAVTLLLCLLPMNASFCTSTTSYCTVVVLIVVGCCLLDPFQLLRRLTRTSLFLGYWSSLSR